MSLGTGMNVLPVMRGKEGGDIVYVPELRVFKDDGLIIPDKLVAQRPGERKRRDKNQKENSSIFGGENCAFFHKAYQLGTGCNGSWSCSDRGFPFRHSLFVCLRAFGVLAGACRAV